MSWLKYMQETLGVRSVLWPESMANASVNEQAAAPAQKPFCVAFVDVQSWSTKEMELFEKMSTAMKLSREQTKIIFASPAEMPQKSLELLVTSSVVFFSPELAAKASELLKETFVITTFGPRELLRDPQLKKQSWDDLQKVMKKLN